MTTQTDAELIAAYAHGADETAFAELVSRHRRTVFRACERMLGDAHEAEDATQAVFIVLVRKATRLRKDGSLNAWLHDVARKVSLEVIRRRASEAKRQDGFVAIGGPDGSEVDRGVDIELTLRRLDESLGSLSPRLREAVSLRYLQGHSEKEAAELAACPQGTLSWRTHEGLAKLKSLLAKRGVALTVPALVGILETESQAAVPETLLSSIASASKLAAANAATGAGATPAMLLAKGAMKTMLMSKIQAAILTVAAIGVAGAVGIAVAQSQAKAEGAVRAAKEVVSPAAGVTNTPLILRDVNVPISMEDSNGMIYVTVPTRILDGDPSPMWYLYEGMAHPYRALLRVTKEEQRQLQALLLETWKGADKLEEAFVVSEEGQTVAIELKGTHAVRRAKDISERLHADFLRAVAVILGPERTEAMNLLAARNRGVFFPYDLGSTRCRMTVSVVDKGTCLFRTDYEDDRRRTSSSPSLPPWPAIAERLGISRDVLVKHIRANSTYLREVVMNRNIPADVSDYNKYRVPSEPIAPPPVLAYERVTGSPYAFVAISTCVRMSTLEWMFVEPSTHSTVNSAWVQTMHLTPPEVSLLADTFGKAVETMDKVCAEGFRVTNKTDDSISGTIDAKAFARFPSLLEAQDKALRNALGNERADIVQMLSAKRIPVLGSPAQLLWSLYEHSQVAPAKGLEVHVSLRRKGDKWRSFGRIPSSMMEQQHPPAYVEIERGPQFDVRYGVTSWTVSLESLPSFLTALWPEMQRKGGTTDGRR